MPPSKPAFDLNLDLSSGVPAYRQIIDQVLAGIASGALSTGTQLPTVRQLAVDLAINPNTVIRAYRELETLGHLQTQQGVGTFVAAKKVKRDDLERTRRLASFAADVAARSGREGFTLREVLAQLRELAEGRE
jgi:GntR family transcriptional regulator